MVRPGGVAFDNVEQQLFDRCIVVPENQVAVAARQAVEVGGCERFAYKPVFLLHLGGHAA